MKKTLRNLIVAGAIGLASLMPIGKLSAQGIPNTSTTETKAEKKDDNLNISLENPFFSKYVFWGLPFSEGPVYQPTLNINYKDFTLTFLSNVDFKTKQVNEGDVFLDFSHNFENKLGTSIGFGAYLFNIDNSWKGLQEAYAGVNFNLPLNPSVTFHRLFGFETGNFIEGSLSKSFPITDRVDIALSGTIGYNDKFLRERSNFSNLETSIAFPINLGNNFSLTPTLSFSKGLADDMTNEFYTGINLTKNF